MAPTFPIDRNSGCPHFSIVEDKTFSPASASIRRRAALMNYRFNKSAGISSCCPLRPHGGRHCVKAQVLHHFSFSMIFLVSARCDTHSSRRVHAAGAVRQAPYSPRLHAFHATSFTPTHYAYRVRRSGTGGLVFSWPAENIDIDAPASTETSMPVTILAGTPPAIPHPRARSRPQHGAPCPRRWCKTAHRGRHPFASGAHGGHRLWGSGRTLPPAGHRRGTR